MEVRELAAGLWRWTARHEEWQEDVGCLYAESPDAVVLVDPLVPPDDPDRFYRALDRDVERLGLPVHVLLTVFFHARSAGELAERYGARVWAPARARAAVERRTGRSADVLRPGRELPGGFEARPTARGTEMVFWLPRHAAIACGDVVLDDGGGLRLCPESWLPPGTGHAELRRSLLPLLDLPVERVLVSHGEPVLENGQDSLRRLLRA